MVRQACIPSNCIAYGPYGYFIRVPIGPNKQVWFRYHPRCVNIQTQREFDKIVHYTCDKCNHKDKVNKRGKKRGRKDTGKDAAASANNADKNVDEVVSNGEGAE